MVLDDVKWLFRHVNTASVVICFPLTVRGFVNCAPAFVGGGGKHH